MKEAIINVLDTFDESQQNRNDNLRKHLVAAAIKYFEDYTEAFRDIYTMYCIDCRKAIPTDLLTCIKNFKRAFTFTENGNRMLAFLYERNKLVHEYYNVEYMTEQFLIVMHNYSDGLSEIYNKLAEEVMSNSLMDKRIER